MPLNNYYKSEENAWFFHKVLQIIYNKLISRTIQDQIIYRTNAK